MTTWHRVLLLIAAGLAAGTASAQYSPRARLKPLPPDVSPQVGMGQCGDILGDFGPFDYRSVDPRDRRVVEAYHFDMELRTFLSGQFTGKNKAGTGPVTGGFVYTLRVMPNHVTALYVMDLLGRRFKSEMPPGTEIPLECWYLRAFSIAPDDPAVHAMYGMYLAFRGRDAEAKLQLAIADRETGRSAPLQYQIGLAHLQIKEYERAQLNAMRAARGGFAIEGLARSLKDGKHWKDDLQLPPEPDLDPVEGTAASGPASAAEAASGAVPGTAASSAR